MCPSEERLSRNVEAGFVEVELVNLRLKNVRHRPGFHPGGTVSAQGSRPYLGACQAARRGNWWWWKAPVSSPRNTVDGPREAEGIVMEASTAALVSHVGLHFCFMMPGLPPLQNEDMV